MRKRILIVALLAGTLPQWTCAQQGPGNRPDLSSMSIEALMDLRVTSVSKKSEPLSRAAAAIYVITQEDIRRSGMNSIPELLRMVPGLDVAQMDASTWAISARGFNSQYATFMLVLVDGRTVYNPTFNGVNWDVQDTALEDIDRIEVICGPGAALWGQNAVNGVINIITKESSGTQGGLITVVAGNLQTPDVAVRYGGPAGPQGHFRILSKYLDRQGQDLASGARAGDGWRNLRLGFRGDWELSDRDSLTVLGGGYQGLSRHLENQIVSLLPPVQQEGLNTVHIAGADILTKWRHSFSERSDITAQAYYDYADRRDSKYGELRNTVDLDFQHHIAIGGRHDFLWGIGWRDTTDNTNGNIYLSFNPRIEDHTTYSVFAQDEIALWPNRLRFVLGARLTDDGYTGAEIQPDGRLLWTPYANHSLWLAVSRPIGTPAFSSRAVRYAQNVSPGPGGLPLLTVILGNPAMAETKSLSLQAGYRGRLVRNLSVSAAGFYSRYQGVRSTSLGAIFLETVPAPAHLVLPLDFQSGIRGETHGLELEGTWQPNSRWRLAAGYTLLLMGLRDALAGSAFGASTTAGTSPRNQFQVHSNVNLPRNWEWDTYLYETGRLPTDNISSHVRMDTRVAWRFAEGASLSLVGQNLLRPGYFEFGSSGGNIHSTQVRRGGYAKFTWTF
jgi:iron complex outermembrane receptor protein